MKRNIDDSHVLRSVTAALIFVITPFAPAGADAPAPIDDVAWLAGCWAAQDGEPGTVEHWLSPAAGTMFGVSRTIRGGRVALFEFMTIRTMAEGQLVFVAQPGAVRQPSLRPSRKTPPRSRSRTPATTSRVA